EVLDAVAIEIAGGDDHASVELARLAPRPVPELLPGGAGIDVELPRERPRLVFRRRRRHGDVALAVGVEIRDRRHDAAEAAPASVRSHPRFSLSVSARFQSSLPVLGERATTTPRMRPSTGAWGAAITRSASPSPEMSGTGITQWPKSPSSDGPPSHARISLPFAPDHTAALPLWNTFCWSLKRAPAAMSAWPSPSTSSGSPKRNPSSPFGTLPAMRRATHQPAPGAE